MSCQCLKHVAVSVGVMSVFETWESVGVMSVFETRGSLCQCHVSV